MWGANIADIIKLPKALLIFNSLFTPLYFMPYRQLLL
jgi:hypothetical protein